MILLHRSYKSLKGLKLVNQFYVTSFYSLKLSQLLMFKHFKE